MLSFRLGGRTEIWPPVFSSIGLHAALGSARLAYLAKQNQNTRLSPALRIARWEVAIALGPFGAPFVMQTYILKLPVLRRSPGCHLGRHPRLAARAAPERGPRRPPRRPSKRSVRKPNPEALRSNLQRQTSNPKLSPTPRP